VKGKPLLDCGPSSIEEDEENGKKSKEEQGANDTAHYGRNILTLFDLVK